MCVWYELGGGGFVGYKLGNRWGRGEVKKNLYIAGMGVSLRDTVVRCNLLWARGSECTPGLLNLTTMN